MFFLELMSGERICRPSTAHQQNTFDGGLTLDVGLVIFHGIRTSIAKEACSFVIFHGGGGGVSGPLSPPLDQHMFASISTCLVLHIFTLDFLSQFGGAIALLIYILCVDEKTV